MTNLYKLMLLVATVFFTHFAGAVIIEGSFSGRTWDVEKHDMEGAPDAKFWENATSWGGYFEGSFWYDTDLAEAPVIEEYPGSGAYASYSGPHNWLHTTLRMNGEEIALTSSGKTGTFMSKPYETINLGYQVNQYGELEESFSLGYYDRVGMSQREGFFIFSPYVKPAPFLNGFSLIQNFSSDGHTQGFIEYLGYVQFISEGQIDGIRYGGLFSGEINKFDIHVRVPEPAAWLLFLCVLPLIIWRKLLTTSVFSTRVSS